MDPSAVHPPRDRHGRHPLFRRRVVPGSSPGVVRVDPAAHPTAIRVWRYGVGGCREAGLDDVDAVAGEVTWIRVQGLGDADLLRRVHELADIHPLAREDVVNVDQRAKVDAYDEGLFVVARAPSRDGPHATEQVSMFLAGALLVSFEERPGPLLDPVLERVRAGRGRIRRLGADYLMYALLDTVVDAYFPVLEDLADELFELEGRTMRRPDAEILPQAHRLKRRIALLRRDAWPHRDLVTRLQRDDGGRIAEPVRPFLADCRDHAVQVVEHLDQLREQAEEAMDLHVSLLDTRMSEVMKVLTMVAGIFIPLSFVTSLYGMNFDRDASPWNMPELGWRYGYPALLLVLLAVAGGIVWWFRRQGWLGGGSAGRGARGSSDSVAPWIDGSTDRR